MGRNFQPGRNNSSKYFICLTKGYTLVLGQIGIFTGTRSFETPPINTCDHVRIYTCDHVRIYFRQEIWPGVVDICKMYYGGARTE